MFNNQSAFSDNTLRQYGSKTSVSLYKSEAIKTGTSGTYLGMISPPFGSSTNTVYVRYGTSLPPISGSNFDLSSFTAITTTNTSGSVSTMMNTLKNAAASSAIYVSSVSNSSNTATTIYYIAKGSTFTNTYSSGSNTDIKVYLNTGSGSVYTMPRMRYTFNETASRFSSSTSLSGHTLDHSTTHPFGSIIKVITGSSVVTSTSMNINFTFVPIFISMSVLGGNTFSGSCISGTQLGYYASSAGTFPVINTISTSSMNLTVYAGAWAYTLFGI